MWFVRIESNGFRNQSAFSGDGQQLGFLGFLLFVFLERTLSCPHDLD